MKHSIEKMRACLPLLPAPGEEVVAECLDEIESMRQQLAAALAACKQKDEVLAAWGNLTTTEWMRVVAKVLAVQPDDSALKTWLGEPIGEVKKHTGSLKDMAIIVWSGEQPAEGTKLYSPKELK